MIQYREGDYRPDLDAVLWARQEVEKAIATAFHFAGEADRTGGRTEAEAYRMTAKFLEYHLIGGGPYHHYGPFNGESVALQSDVDAYRKAGGDIDIA